MTPHEKRIVQFLLKPSSYSHPVTQVLRRETHVSHVFLAGVFAYKLKKSVKFPFLDSSTLTRRRRFCHLELVLNRRLAPSVYLDLVPVTDSPKGLRLGQEDRKDRVIEWLVRMHRLPEERMLDRLVARHAVRPKDIKPIAERLIRFFKSAHRSSVIDRYGAPKEMQTLLLDNLHECEIFVGRLVSRETYAFLEAAYRQILALYEPLWMRRIREGRIIDGHGDLRCENICMTNPVSIFDCVEFQKAFRYGDMANDLSFLLMDLEFRGRKDLARVLVERYRKNIADSTLDRVLPVYQCHRSLVRGKVRGLAWLQHPRTKEGRRIRKLSCRHFDLALAYARGFAPPRLIAVGGLIGTGKSTLAKHLSQALGAAWLRTDEIRLREFANKRSTHQGFAQGIYAPHISDLVYHRLIQRAETLVSQGQSVICDGTFSKASGRESLRDVARRHGASFHFLECVVPKAVAMNRLRRRFMAQADLSEAQPTHYEWLSRGYEPVRGFTASEWTRLNTSGSSRSSFQTALHALRHVWTPELSLDRNPATAIRRAVSL